MRLLSSNLAAGLLGLIALGAVPATVGAQATVTTPQQAVVNVHSNANGFVASLNGETLQVIVCSDAVVHIVAAPGDAAVEGASPDQPWLLDKSKVCPGAKFDFAQGADGAWLTTAKFRVKIETKAGNLVYSTTDGTELLRERPAVPRTYEPVELNGEKTLTVEDRFMPAVTEGLYGLGQHQNGMFNYRGATVELGQDNSDIAVPLLVSNQGYGLLWNTASLTYFDDRYPPALGIRSISENALGLLLYLRTGDGRHHSQIPANDGQSPLLPEWAFGFFQSKDTYTSQAEISELQSDTAPNIFRWTAWCRTGGGGRRWVTRVSSQSIPTLARS